MTIIYNYFQNPYLKIEDFSVISLQNNQLTSLPENFCGDIWVDNNYLCGDYNRFINNNSSFSFHCIDLYSWVVKTLVHIYVKNHSDIDVLQDLININEVLDGYGIGDLVSDFSFNLNGRLRSLHNNWFDISYLPPSIGLLTELDEIYINNSLIRSIPQEIEHLNLFNVSFRNN